MHARILQFLYWVSFFYLAIWSLQTNAQIITGQNALDIAGGKSDLGYMIRAGFVHFFSSSFSVKGEGFYESANPYQLKYKNYGVAALARYRVLNLNEIIFVTPYLGPEVNFDHLSPVKSNFSSSLNFGLQAGVEAEAVISNSFSFVGYFNQMLLANSKFGRERYDYGLGLRFYIGN